MTGGGSKQNFFRASPGSEEIEPRASEKSKRDRGEGTDLFAGLEPGAVCGDATSVAVLFLVVLHCLGNHWHFAFGAGAAAPPL